MADKLGMLSWTSSYTRYVWCFICPNIIVVSHFETTFLDSHFEELGSCLLASCDIHFSWQPLDDFPQCHVSRLPSQPCTLCPTSRQILQQTVPYLTPHFHSQPASSCFPRLAGIRPFFSGSYTHLPYLSGHTGRKAYCNPPREATSCFKRYQSWRAPWRRWCWPTRRLQEQKTLWVPGEL